MKSIYSWLLTASLSITLQTAANEPDTYIAELTKKADMGDLDSLFSLATHYRISNDGKDSDLALKYLLQAANMGHAEAQWMLGTTYFVGDMGLPEDYPIAIEWYKKAAEQGYIHAQEQMAFMYVHGCGVPKDLKLAVEWYAKAAKQGSVKAQVSLGKMYLYGRGVGLDYEEAIFWYTKAATQKDRSAASQLGFMNYYGLGVAEDSKQAFEWYKKAAGMGSDSAKTIVGLMYYRGAGVDVDLVEAYAWALLVTSDEALEYELIDPNLVQQIMSLISHKQGSNENSQPMYRYSPNTNENDLGFQAVFTSEHKLTGMKKVLEKSLTAKQMLDGQKRANEIKDQMKK